MILGVFGYLHFRTPPSFAWLFDRMVVAGQKLFWTNLVLATLMVMTGTIPPRETQNFCNITCSGVAHSTIIVAEMKNCFVWFQHHTRSNYSRSSHLGWMVVLGLFGVLNGWLSCWVRLEPILRTVSSYEQPVWQRQGIDGHPWTHRSWQLWFKK